MDLASLSKMENRFHLSTALLNYSSETNDLCDSGTLKTLASGEAIPARRLYNDSFKMAGYARLACNTNDLPKNVQHLDGFFRRFLVMPFSVKIAAENQDLDLPNKITSDELPGVFNWAMAGMRRLRENRKLSQCNAAAQALATYRKESDSVAMFLEEQELVPSDDGKIGKDQLYRDYRDYCRASGDSAESKVTFGKRLSGQFSVPPPGM